MYFAAPAFFAATAAADRKALSCCSAIKMPIIRPLSVSVFLPWEQLGIPSHGMLHACCGAVHV